MFKKLITLIKKTAPVAQEQSFTEDEIRKLKKMAGKYLG